MVSRQTAGQMSVNVTSTTQPGSLTWRGHVSQQLDAAAAVCRCTDRPRRTHASQTNETIPCLSVCLLCGRPIGRIRRLARPSVCPSVCLSLRLFRILAPNKKTKRRHMQKTKKTKWTFKGQMSRSPEVKKASWQRWVSRIIAPLVARIISVCCIRDKHYSLAMLHEPTARSHANKRHKCH